ncbi:MAG: hypothetical protein RSE55_08470, partial [Lachnospiraceae bacterium]
MLGKLMKHDGNAMNKSIVPYYGILVLMAVIARVCGEVGKHFAVMKVINTFLVALVVIGMIGIMLFSGFTVIRRYYKNTLRDEGYLTNTLPIKRSNIVVSKVIWSLVYGILGIFMIVLVFGIVFYSKDVMSVLKGMGTEMAAGFGVSLPVLAISAIIWAELYFVAYILIIMAGMSIGQRFNDKKLVWSVVISIVIYYVYQIVAVIVLGLSLFLRGNIMEEFSKSMPSTGLLQMIFLLMGGLTILLMIVCYLISCQSV